MINPKKNKNKNKLSAIQLGFFLIFLVLVGCSASISSDKTLGKEIILAVVNGETISKKDFVEEFKLMKRKYRIEHDDKVLTDQIILLKTKALNELIRSLLFRQEAAKYNIEVEGEQLRRMLNGLRSEYSEDSLQKVFQVGGVNRLVWEKKLKDSIIINKLIKKVIDDHIDIEEEALKIYFEKHPEEFQKPKQISALHIMVATEEEARSVLKKLESGVENFSNLAIKYSLSPESSLGGDLGYFEAGQMPEEFDGVFKLELRKVSEVIQTPYGYHIFKVTDKRSARKMKYRESRNKIRAKLLEEKRARLFHEWLVDLRGRAQIKIHEDIIKRVNG